MGKPSKIDKLPPEIRDTINDLIDRHYTLDEILAHLATLPISPTELPSRSGLGRHVKGLNAIAERVQRSRAVAEALVRKLGDAPESRQTRLNIELMHSVITDLMMGAAEAEAHPNADGGGPQPPVMFDPQQVMFLAKSLDHLAHAGSLDTVTTLKLRQEQERKTKEAAVKAAESVARERGLTADTVAAIRAQILGVKTAA